MDGILFPRAVPEERKGLKEYRARGGYDALAKAIKDTPEDIVKIVSIALGQGRVFPSKHFRQRMGERNFDINDAIRVLEETKEVRPKWNTSTKTWNYDIPGMDIEGEKLTIRIAIAEDEREIVLVTGF